MNDLASNFGFEKRTQDLVAGMSEGRRRSSISQKARKISAGTVKRVIAQELENTYFADAITFNSVNKNTQMIMAAGYRFHAEDPKILKEFQEFINNLGTIGDSYTFDELIESALRSEQIFGYGWLENVYNEDDTMIVDITKIDAKTMDYARDAMGNVVLDQSLKPVGYVQTVGDGLAQTQGVGDPVPNKYTNKIKLEGGQIFLSPKRIALFKLYTASDGLNSFGLVEPAYKSILRKLNIEEAQANSIYARGTFPLIDYVGNEKNPATPQRMEQALEMIKKFQHDRYFALPYYHKVEPVEVKQSDIVVQTLKHLRENQSASFGMPLAFATGAGEATNRATLTNQQQMLMYTLNDIIKKTLANFTKQILVPLAENRGWKEVPQIIWNRVNPEELNEKTLRLQKWVELGVLNPTSMTDYIIKVEELPINSELAKKKDTPPTPKVNPFDKKPII